MKAHLVNPPAARGVDMVREGRCMQRAGAWTAVWAPISLATIAAVLEEDDITCRLDDCIIEKVDRGALVERARSFSPDIFVINTATPSIVCDLELADALKKEFPNSLILAIGIHVTALPEESLAMAPGLDAVVRAEPELTVLAAAKAHKEGKSISNIPGISTRDAHGPDRPPADLDSLPYPAWHLVERDLYRLPFSDKPFLLIGTSRGCPFQCKFCADPAYYGHKLSTKSPGRIVAELKHVRDTYGIRDFLFWSESFTLKRDWTDSVLKEIIEADLGIRFVVNSRTGSVDPDLLALMKEAGCWMIGYGIESGSQAMLDLMGKRTTIEESRQAVVRAKQAGLKVTAHTVLGYPGETDESIEQTIDFVCSLPIDFAQFYCATPFPGSALYEEAKEKGWLVDAPWEKFEQNFCVIRTPELSEQEVMAWRSRAYRRFYLRPAKVWQVIRDEVGIRGAPRFVRMVIDFREWI